jgi:hypothetical protein
VKIFGVFRVKNHDFTPKNHIFSNFRGVRAPWIRPCIVPTAKNKIPYSHPSPQNCYKHCIFHSLMFFLIYSPHNEHWSSGPTFAAQEQSNCSDQKLFKVFI